MNGVMNGFVNFVNYIYLYIYICIYLCNIIYIGWSRWNEDTTSKNKLFSQLLSAVVVLKGYVEFEIYKCWMIFDVILRLTSVILDHMQKRKIMEVNGKSAWNGFNLGLGSDQVKLKSQVS